MDERPVKIEDFLSPEHAIAALRANDKARVLDELSARAAAALGVTQERVMQEISKREGLGSTGVGGGVAIPHARLADLCKPFGILARLKHPIAFEAIDQKPVDFVFFVLTPAADQGEHLNALAAIARKLREPERLKALRDANDNEALYRAMIK